MIFTERQITVHKGKSSINESVILYRGDFEVSIKFTIMESKFRFKSGVNLVDSEKASYGQLAILAPYGGNVFSEEVKCEDGTVTFTLTKEMIDQLEEVGLYSFQIRLFDYYRESRVSIPPVEFGIEVREPVASEDHDNSVNNAIVGYSIAKVVDPSKEDVGDTFNASGQYNKTDWETGDRITEGKLNKIEDALDKINQNEISDVAALNRTVTSNYNVLNSTKSDISYVDTKISAVVSGSPKGTYSTVAALTSAKPKGDNNIYVVTADGHWYYWSGSAWTSGGVYQSVLLEDESVKHQHIQGINNCNICTEDTKKAGYVKTDGSLRDGDSSTAYAKIPVKSGHTYIVGRADISQTGSISSGDPFMVLNSNSTKIAFDFTGSFYVGTDKNRVRYMKYTIPEDGAFLCFNLWVNAYDARESTYCYDAEGIIEPIEDIKALDVVHTLFDRQVSDEQARDAINNLRESIVSMSRDIYTSEAVIYEEQYANLEGVTSNAVGWKRAQIPIKPNSIYSVYFPSEIYDTNRGAIGFLDIYGKWVSSSRWEKLLTDAINGCKYAIIPTPDNAAYISFSITAGQSLNYYYDDIEGTIFVEGSKLLSTDLINIVEKIDGKPLFTPDNFDKFITLPKISGTWDDNLLRSPDTIIKQGELYNNSGQVQIASGWTRAVIPVTSGATYYFHSPSDVYTVQGRGQIMLLDSSTNIIMQIEGQNTDVVYTNNYQTKWQVIKTTSETSYVGLTVGNPNGNLMDFENGVFQESYPANGDELPILISVDGLKVPNNSTGVDTSAKYNMFETGTMTDGYLYNKTGTKQASSGWRLIDIPVTGMGTYYFYSPSQIYNSGKRGAIVLLDSSKNTIQVIEGQNTNLYIPVGGSNEWQVITTTSDTAYVGISIKSNLSGNADQYDDTDSGVFIAETPQVYHEQEYILAINNLPLYSTVGANNSNHPLKGKKWVVIGDSLTEFNYRATKNYHHWVADETGVIVHNMGVSGTGYMRQQENDRAFYQRITKIPTDADIITIFGSGNDLSQTLGTPSDTGTDTICGCMHATFQALFEVMPGAKVGVVLPCPWGGYPPSVKDNKMALYCEALKEIAGQYSIPVLDLYHGSNLRPWDPTFRDLYYKHDDGNTVHPDEDGHKILANKFKMFIQSL